MPSGATVVSAITSSPSYSVTVEPGVPVPSSVSGSLACRPAAGNLIAGAPAPGTAVAPATAAGVATTICPSATVNSTGADTPNSLPSAPTCLATRLCVPAARGGTVSVHVPSGATVVSAITSSPSYSVTVEPGVPVPSSVSGSLACNPAAGNLIAGATRSRRAAAAGVATTICPSATVSSTGADAPGSLPSAPTCLATRLCVPATRGGTVSAHVPSGATMVSAITSSPSYSVTVEPGVPVPSSVSGSLAFRPRRRQLDRRRTRPGTAVAPATAAGVATTICPSATVNSTGADTPNSLPSAPTCLATRLCVPAARGGTVSVHVPSGATVVEATTASPSYSVTVVPGVPVPSNVSGSLACNPAAGNLIAGRARRSRYRRCHNHLPVRHRQLQWALTQLAPCRPRRPA